MSVSSNSLKGDGILQSVQDILEEKRYPPVSS